MRQAQQREYMQLQSDAFDVAVGYGFVAKFHVDGAYAAASDETSVLTATALTAAAQTITTGIANPKASRNLQVVGNTAGMTGNVVVHGIGFDGKTISETFALNGATVVVGNVAFHKVTEIDLPVQSGAGDTVSVGVGDKLGLPFKLSLYDFQAAFLNKVKEGTAPTFAVDAANMENNTVTLASALNGNDVDVWLIV